MCMLLGGLGYGKECEVLFIEWIYNNYDVIIKNLLLFFVLNLLFFIIVSCDV